MKMMRSNPVGHLLVSLAVTFLVSDRCWAHMNAGQQYMGQQPPPQMGGVMQPHQGQIGVPHQQQYGMPQQQALPPPQGGHVAPGANPHGHVAPGAHPHGSMLRDKNTVQDRAHIQEHLQEILGDGQDLSKMSEDELQFHYFKLHDNDDNNRLDGLELVKSLIHWHVEEHKHLSQNQQGGQQQHQTPPPSAPSAGGHETTKIFTDQELVAMIDPILEMDDSNRDGFIDYPEFVAAQKQRGF